MKSFLFVSTLFCIFNTAIALSTEPRAIIKSIDDYDYQYNYVEVSEEGLPSDLYQKLLLQTDLFRFTPITSARAGEIFGKLKRDPRARMKSPGGLCSRRRIYIQNVLRGMNIVSGKLYLSCPAKNGNLRLRDQVSGRNYTYSNFHDTNVVLVNSGSGNSYQIFDLQFQSRPVSLENYLAQIEAFQRIEPAKRNDIKAGICFWSISSPGDK
jgi:hypothetical protein